MAPTDLTIEILKQIRDETAATRAELVATRTELGARIDAVRTELGARVDAVRTELGARADVVEATLTELASQQRFVVRHLATLTRHDRRLGDEVDELRTRVDALEERVGAR